MNRGFYKHPEIYTETEIAADWVLGFMVFWVDEPVPFLEMAEFADEIGITPAQLHDGQALLRDLIVTWNEHGEELWQFRAPHESWVRVLANAFDRWLDEGAMVRDRETLRDVARFRSIRAVGQFVAAGVREGGRCLCGLPSQVRSDLVLARATWKNWLRSNLKGERL